jgi:proteic killer suppression protein
VPAASPLAFAGYKFIPTLDKCNLWGYKELMIKSFKHKGLEDFFYTGKKKGIKPEHADRLGRILDRLNAASEIRDMNYPGSNLHKLAGDKKDQYAVRVSGNWRVFFEFINGNAYIVDYGDYH